MNKKLRDLKYKKILLLQGPIGNFFNDLEEYLSQKNIVDRIIFNGGDYYYSKKNNISPTLYTKTPSDWVNFIKAYLQALSIDVVILFGQYRYYHYEAIKICKKFGIDYYVFEEGYLRPNFITFEKSGVNYDSKNFPNDKNFYENLEFQNDYKKNINQNSIIIEDSYTITVRKVVLYYIFSFLYHLKFRHYIHHRGFNLFKETFYQIRKYIRTRKYKKKEHREHKKIQENHNYFFVPLQLYFDAQIKYNSKYSSMRHFMEDVISSFSLYANEEDYLVIKHHPLGNGYTNYKKDIFKLVRKYNVKKRVLYIHDGDYSSQVKNCKGVVLINSTVGISALYHLKALYILGEAFYNINGLTNNSKMNLDQFWTSHEKPDEKLVSNFLNYILQKTQMVGNFYVDGTILNFLHKKDLKQL